MSDLKMTGEIVKILEVEKGTTKAGKDWQKLTFVINNGNQYNPEVAFQIFGIDKVEKFNKFNKVGSKVDVSFNVSSREFNGKYYNSLDAWKVFKAEETKEAVALADESNDLPF